MQEHSAKDPDDPAAATEASIKEEKTVSEDILTTTVDDPDITTMEPAATC